MCLDNKGNQHFSSGSKIIFWQGNTEREKVPNHCQRLLQQSIKIFVVITHYSQQKKG